MLASDVRGPRFDPQPGQKVFSIFPPVTFGAQPKITHPMAWSTSMSKTDSWNVKLRFEDESKMEGEYVVIIGIIHTCTALQYKPAFKATL